MSVAEILAQPVEKRIGDTVRPLPGDDRVFDDELVPLIKNSWWSR